MGDISSPELLVDTEQQNQVTVTAIHKQSKSDKKISKKKKQNNNNDSQVNPIPISQTLLDLDAEIGVAIQKQRGAATRHKSGKSPRIRHGQQQQEQQSNRSNRSNIKNQLNSQKNGAGAAEGVTPKRATTASVLKSENATDNSNNNQQSSQQQVVKKQKQQKGAVDGASNVVTSGNSQAKQKNSSSTKLVKQQSNVVNQRASNLNNPRKRSSASSSRGAIGAGLIVQHSQQPSEGNLKKSKTTLKQQQKLPVIAAEEIKLMNGSTFAAEKNNSTYQDSSSNIISKVNNFSLVESAIEDLPPVKQLQSTSAAANTSQENLEESKEQKDHYQKSTFSKQKDNRLGQQQSPTQSASLETFKDAIKIQQSSIENTDEDSMEMNEADESAEFQRRLKQIKRIELPAPLELIAKSSYKPQEPVKTGAPIPFLSLAQLAGGRFREEEVCGPPRDKKTEQDNQFPVNLKPDVATLRASTTNIQQYMAAMNENGYVVYCRFGAEYIGHLIRQQTINNNNPQMNQPHMRQIATYLINIKKLIKDHNIESDTKDFAKLRTQSNMKKTKADLPPTPFYLPDGPEDKTLVFESRFETGNLLASMKVSDNEYDLVLQNDINTNGHTQWFFFRVGNTRKGQTVKFNILNLAKPDSLYNHGMRVLSFSQISRDGPEELSWHRIGEHISYHQNSFKREFNRFNRCYYTLTFTHTFTENNDQVYFAHCFPYTYSDLQDDLTKIEKDRFSQNFVSRSTLCRTLAGNRCEYITITSKERDPNSEKAKAKKGVFISSRVHPGESNASWMMKGLIEFLVSHTAEAQALRENFIFKIVPMLNPDGVINGNYRCSLAGQDLNRRWKVPSRSLHPVNHHVKRMIREFNKERQIVLVCDLHGHSRRKNIFMYGNNFEERPHATRVFPYILSKLLDFFSFESSRFSVHKSKESTARVCLWRELKIPNVFTMEASFCGADKGALENKHFMPEHFMLAGRKILEALIVYQKLQVNPLKPNQISNSLTNKKQKKQVAVDAENGEEIQAYKQIKIDDIELELTQNKKLIEMTKGDEDGDDTAGSDSEPSEDNLSDEEMAKIIPVKPKKEPVKPGKDKNMQRRGSAKKLEDKSPSARAKPQPLLSKGNVSRSPIKRIFPYQNPYDRMMRRGIKKVEMVDAWTQTSNRGSDNEDAQAKQKKREREQQQQKTKGKPAGGQQQNLHDSSVQRINGGIGGQAPLLDNKGNSKQPVIPRSSLESIYHQQAADGKHFQQQQDRRLAQLHRQSSQLGGGNQQQPENATAHPFQNSKRAGNLIGKMDNQQNPHLTSEQNHPNSVSGGIRNPSNPIQPSHGPSNSSSHHNNQLRIRKDPIRQPVKTAQGQGLAIYEQALLKSQTKHATVTNPNEDGRQMAPVGPHHAGTTSSMSHGKPVPTMVLMNQQSSRENHGGNGSTLSGAGVKAGKMQRGTHYPEQGNTAAPGNQKTFTTTRLGPLANPTRSPGQGAQQLLPMATSFAASTNNKNGQEKYSQPKKHQQLRSVINPDWSYGHQGASSTSSKRHPGVALAPAQETPSKRAQNYMNVNGGAANSSMSHHREQLLQNKAQTLANGPPQLVKTSDVHRSTLIQNSSNNMTTTPTPNHRQASGNASNANSRATTNRDTKNFSRYVMQVHKQNEQTSSQQYQQRLQLYPHQQAQNQSSSNQPLSYLQQSAQQVRTNSITAVSRMDSQAQQNRSRNSDSASGMVAKSGISGEKSGIMKEQQPGQAAATYQQSSVSHYYSTQNALSLPHKRGATNMVAPAHEDTGNMPQLQQQQQQRMMGSEFRVTAQNRNNNNNSSFRRKQIDVIAGQKAIQPRSSNFDWSSKL